MVETILEIAHKVIGSELSQNRDVIVGLLRKTLLSTSPNGEIIVTVSPEDYETVMENKERLTEGFKISVIWSLKRTTACNGAGVLSNRFRFHRQQR